MFSISVWECSSFDARHSSSISPFSPFTRWVIYLSIPPNLPFTLWPTREHTTWREWYWSLIFSRWPNWRMPLLHPSEREFFVLVSLSLLFSDRLPIQLRWSFIFSTPLNSPFRIWRSTSTLSRMWLNNWWEWGMMEMESKEKRERKRRREGRG